MRNAAVNSTTIELRDRTSLVRRDPARWTMLISVLRRDFSRITNQAQNTKLQPRALKAILSKTRPVTAIRKQNRSRLSRLGYRVAVVCRKRVHLRCRKNEEFVPQMFPPI